MIRFKPANGIRRHSGFKLGRKSGTIENSRIGRMRGEIMRPRRRRGRNRVIVVKPPKGVVTRPAISRAYDDAINQVLIDNDIVSYDRCVVSCKEKDVGVILGLIIWSERNHPMLYETVYLVSWYPEMDAAVKEFYDKYLPRGTKFKLLVVRDGCA
jgi:hypothetical protein